MTSRVWLITGTSSGFGRRLVISVLRRGDRVIATARSLEKLQDLVARCDPEHRDNIRTVQLDITEGEAALKAKVVQAAAIWGQINVLVNNAGIGFPSILEEGGSALLRKQFEANVFGTMDMTVATLPYLRAMKDAVMVVVGSRSAWKTEIPGIGPYACSKAAVHSLTETLSAELAQFNIRVLLVAPGSFRTEGIYGQDYNTTNPIAANDAMRELSFSRFKAIPGTEKGDPDKAMEAVVDVVRGEGIAKGRPWPGYLVLGEDAEKDVRDKCNKVLRVLDEWKDVACGILQIRYTLGRQALEDPYHINIIRTTLTKNLESLLPHILDEAAHAYEAEIGSKLSQQVNPEWTPIGAQETFQQLICQVSSRSFVGLPLCRNKEYCALNIQFTTNVMTAAAMINLFPRVLKPLIGALYDKLSGHQKRMLELLGPEIKARKRKYNDFGVDYEDKPNDMLAWLMEAATSGEEQTTDSLSLRMLNVNFMSIHSTYVSFTHTVYNLASHPHYLEILRDEIHTHLDPSRGTSQWSIEDIERCVKLDSFLKESLRLNGLGAISLPRKALVSFRLPDGTLVPAGTIVSAASTSAHLDSAHYERPEEFDGLRFAALREKEATSDEEGCRAEIDVKYRLTSAGPAFLTFGGGKHICPGRFFGSLVLKCMLIHLVLNFDMKMEDEGVRPKDDWMGPTSMPAKDAKEGKDVDSEKMTSPSVEPCRQSGDAPATQQPVYDSSLFKALHASFFNRIWIAGVLHLLSDVLRTTTPLLNKVILTWLTNSYVYYRLSDEQKASGIVKEPQGIGYGIGLAFALFVMQQVASLMANHFLQLGMTNGLYMRAAIIGAIFRKSTRLSGRARLEHTVGQITTMISTDATRIDQFAAFAHYIWVAPIQIVIGFGLLLGNLGYSALVGLGVLIIGVPFQAILVVIMFKQREKGVKITDTRVRLTTEVLQGIRLLKMYAWENFYANQIGKLRAGEIATIRKSSIASSILIASITFIPIIAIIMSFITYSLTGHELSVATVFTSLQLFNIIRIPLLIFPIILSSLADLLVALGRISKFLSAEELGDYYAIDESLPNAVDVDGDFTWETAGKMSDNAKPSLTDEKETEKKKEEKKGKQKKKEKKEKGKKAKNKDILPTTLEKVEPPQGEEDKENAKEEEKPFELKNLKLSVPKGAFVAIVGRVGSGKSSVLQSLIGEMRKTRGNVVFGGSIAYVPQAPWIRNATLRENVLFGHKDDEEKFREIVRACHLEHDLEMLPHGERTEIGEKGINLSGGQKARVSLARAAYSGSDIVLLDDPLSAVDAYVGKAILDECLLAGPLSKRTRILVTHALHVLDKTDYIYVMDHGIITEQGTYDDLMKDSAIFSSLMEEYGGIEVQKGGQLGGQGKAPATLVDSNQNASKEAEAALMQTEERNTGAVSWDVYKKYLRFAGGIFWAPIILVLLVVNEGSQVGNNLFLGFWTGNTISGFTQGKYMAVYAGFGAAQAVFSFLLSLAFALMSLVGSLRLFKAALNSVLRSPISFFDTTPMGRIQSRLSKDQDTLDMELSVTLWQFLSTLASVMGTVALVFYTFPLLGILFAPLSVLYYISSVFYRRTSVETKRLDSLLRSIMYGSYSETLTGLATIRAYREQNTSVVNAENGLDKENRAYYMTISIQRWLAVRLDLFGNILILGIALFAAGFRHTVNPAKVGVVLSYTLGITQAFSEMINQFAKNEQNMNAVERVLHYAELPSEPAATTPDDPPATWPAQGQISFTNVELAYREGLPLVLKGVSFEINPGEKVGIVGRTGAGKTSLLQALFRIVELHNGKIAIDGYDISKIGLSILRGSLALVPQDSTLFLGTLRDNLDPQGLRTDAELISVLQRAWLLPSDGTIDAAAEAKFSLDSTVGDEGSNFSAGEKQLLALCRALVKDSRIIILDEATSSVDVETDAKLQRTIKKEFASSTLLCIAHRLNTIAYYDRVLVMDAGKVAEFDTVLNLYDNESSIFRSLCSEANLHRADILRIRAEHSEE
ncbi:hypothetical protein D9615_009789 [Tricholomella constricta]|uniref:Uncharacterized protein n=1 Tax=Tricholomella constricta TaxID=117010 RepID=A0A8H5LVD4_9AGAR|nr:hypothetical protein D9615_009789 [Tricholomella constricta]